MVWLLQPNGLAHHSGLFVCNQYVSGVVISTTRPGSPFVLASLCAISMQVVWLFQPQGLAHHSVLFVCHQYVSGVVISTTRPGSPFWPVCVPSGCKWCGYFNQMAWLTILASSVCKWCGYFNHKAWLTILASFVCHQVVSGVVISTTRPDSPFWPLCVISM